MGDQLDELRLHIGRKFPHAAFNTTLLANGGVLISVRGVPLGPGWNRSVADVHFVQPPGYPASAPDCMWVEPGGLRLANGATPQASNDGNGIPGDPQPGRSTTWFSWHVQAWNPSTDRLLSFFQRILDRFQPAR